VNVASRIESIAAPGSVLVSDKVYDEIKNLSTITTASMGTFHLKNVKRPIEVFAITSDGLAVPSAAYVAMKAGSDRSIAVLPFRNLSAEPETEYFSDGISEEILNALSQVEGLRVCSRSSSFRFKNQEEDIRQIGQKLGVSSVLEGSVRRGGNRVRISAQLVNTSDGYHIWSEVFDGNLDDIFEVQDEIATKIVDRLKQKFSNRTDNEPGTQASKEPSVVVASTDNVEAYNLYLKGRFHRNKSHPEDIHKAIGAFEQAIALDPEFASAYCMLSYCYSFLGSAGVVPKAEAFSKAKDYTLRAIEIDPNHAESHLSHATIKFMQNWDFAGASASIQKAKSLGLNSSELHQLDGMVLVAQGRFNEAVDRIEEALKREPLSLSMRCMLGDAYSFARRFDEALEQYDKVLELEPNFRRAYEGKGFVYLAKYDPENAIRFLEQYQKMIGHPLKGLGGLGYAYGLAGYHDKALDCLARTQERERTEPGINMSLEYALINAGLGEINKSFEYLNSLYEQRSSVVCIGMIYCARYPILDEIKADPRFQQFMQSMGLQNS
jgi:TolB-like protein/Tfp pilus assembly protein PilF